MDEYPIIDLSHLLPAAQGLARLPADERVQRIRADRWIGYPRSVEALNRLETLYAWPNKQRMPNLLLIGPINNGKSMNHREIPADTPGQHRCRPGAHPRAGGGRLTTCRLASRAYEH